MSQTYNLADLIKKMDAAVAGVPGNIGRGAREQFTVLRELFVAARPPAVLVSGRNSSERQRFIRSLFNNDPAGRIMASTAGLHCWTPYSTGLGTINIMETGDVDTVLSPETGQEGPIPDCIAVMMGRVDQRDFSRQIAGWRRIRQRSSGQNMPGSALFFLLEGQGKLPEGTGAGSRTIPESEKIKSESGKPFPEREHFMIVPEKFFSSDGILAVEDLLTRDIIIRQLADILPLSARLQFARLCGNREVQKQVADQTIKPVATACGAIALNPLPVADIMPMTSAQLAMVSAIGCVAGREMSRKTVLEFLSAAGMNIGGAFALREASRALCKIMAPLIGSAASAGVAYTGTIAVGKAATAYFIDEKPVPRVKDILGQFRKKTHGL